MADLATSAVAYVRGWTEGSVTGKERIARLLTLTLTGQGTVANKIPASALGFLKVEECSSAVLSDNTLVLVASPSADGTFVLLKAAATNAPDDYTGAFTLTVKGY